MKKMTPSKLNRFFIAFLAVAAAFLAVGFGTLGSFHSVGDAYLLAVRQEGDQDAPSVTFKLENPRRVKTNDDGTETEETLSLRLTEIYVNVASIHAEEGVPAKLTVERKTSSSSASYGSAVTATLENFFTPGAKYDEEGKEIEKAVVTTGKNVRFRYVMPFLPTSSSSSSASAFGTGWSVSTYPYIRLIASGGVNVLLNEVVFVGVPTSVSTSDTNLSTERYIIPAKVDSATYFQGEKQEDGRVRAQALLDDTSINYSGVYAAIDRWNAAHADGGDTKDKAPSLLARKVSDIKDFFPVSESSFSQFTADEVYSLMTIAEMRQGATYYNNADDARATYFADNVSGAFGTDFLALGTLIFGTSPFGLRFFPMLAMFGVLVVLSRFVTRLARSEKAGLVFAVLFALSCLTLGIAHTGTPFAIGLFFFACALDIVHRFYANGIKKATFTAVLPLLFAGFFLAGAICVNGAFVIPAVAVAALFVLGVVRMKGAKKYALEKIETEPEPLPAPLPAEGTEEEPPVPKEVRIAREKAGYRFRFTAAPVLFAAGLVVGALLFALLGMIPAYYTYVKVYDPTSDLANPTMNVFTLAWQCFVNGFTGANPYGVGGGWNFFRTVFTGKQLAGDYALAGVNAAPSSLYGVTMYTVNWIAALAVIAGIVGAVLVLVRAVRSGDKRELRIALRRLLIPAVLAVCALVAAAVSPAAEGFVLLAWLMAFALTAPASSAYGTGRAVRIAEITALVLLVAVFGLLAVFTFSVPLPATVLTPIFG